MALPVTQDAVDYLRIETSAENALIATLLTRAKASIERALGYPMTAASTVFRDLRHAADWVPVTELEVPGPFKTSSPVPTITDKDGVTVSSDCYILDPDNCKVVAQPWYEFANGPYTFTADIGLSAHSAYSTQCEPIAGGAILDFVSDLYWQRNPSVKSETDEAGAGIQLREDAVPPRVMQSLLLLPGADRMMAR